MQQAKLHFVGRVGQGDRPPDELGGLPGGAREEGNLRSPGEDRPELQSDQSDGIVDLRPELEHAFEVLERLGRPRYGRCIPGRVDRRLQRLDRPPGRRPVVRQLAGDRACRKGSVAAEGAGETRVELLALARQDGGVDRLGQQRVAEPERSRRLVGDEHLVLDRPAQRLDELRLGQRSDRGEEPVRNVAPGGRSDPQQRLGFAVEAGEPLQQHVAESPWKRLLAPFGGRDELLGKEGISLRALADLGHALGGQRRLGDRDEESLDLVRAERLQRQSRRPPGLA